MCLSLGKEEQANKLNKSEIIKMIFMFIVILSYNALHTG
jgi:hypothetical protein